METFLQGRLDQRAYISCNGTCRGQINTAPYFVAGNGTQIAAVELSQEVLANPALNLCENVFHELMHAARVRTAPGVDHDKYGNDRVYSCARVCSGCSHWSNGAGNDQKDCAVCAEGSRKQVCGLKPKVMETRADGDAMCFNGEGAAACNAHPVQILHCDDTRSGNEDRKCCESCPAGFTSFYDFCPVLRSPTWPGNSCRTSERLWLCDV